MAILDTNSLVHTLDNINTNLLLEAPISPQEGLDAARWIASRQGEKGSYRGMFAPTEADFEQGIHVFTGETLVCASARHIMGEEAARAVWLLGRQDPEVRAAYERATAWMRAASADTQNGTFCCGRCTLAFWRHYWAGDFRDKEALISRGLQALQAERLGDGKWRRFPFYYAIYALQELDLEAARSEIKYAQPAMERALRTKREGSFSHRRRLILENALGKL
jgi:hypothetical protein